MQHFIRKKNYKARDPVETVGIIRALFDGLDIRLKETVCNHKDSSTSAVKLEFADAAFREADLSVNGKGMDPDYALASAYGEMMERLQCQMLLRPYRRKAFAEGNIRFLHAPDECSLSFREIMDRCGDLVRSYLNVSDGTFDRLFAGLDGCQSICLPFYDMQEKTVRYLPYELFLRKTGSNGMCSGNTPEEAISQGLCELYERQALMLLYRDNPEIPHLNKELFAGSEILKRLQTLEDFGYRYDILDCSMELNYPVIGLRLCCEDGVLIDLGADPDPVVALERCLTEQFQIIRPEAVRNRFSKESCGLRQNQIYPFQKEYYHSQLLRSRYYGSGKKPDNVYYPSCLCHDFYPSKNDPAQSDLAYLTLLTKKNGYHLLVRDCSWLGFPSYIVFSPELSMSDYLYEENAAVFAQQLKCGRPAPDPKCYEAVLPLLKRLDSIYENNLPEQKVKKE